MTWIMSIANEHGLQVIEDSCETMFAECDKVPVGSLGTVACFSTYVAHLIVGGVGGLVTTQSDYINEVCESLMNHGRDSVYTSIDDDDTEDPDLMRDMIQRRYKFERVGYSYRATELEAAIALSELKRWKENINARQTNAACLTRLLSDISELQLPVILPGMTHSFMMYPMVARPGVDRDKLLMYLEKNGIETRYLFPLLSQPIYRKLFPGEEEKHPVSKRLGEQGFFIGIHQGLTIGDMDYVSEVFHNYFRGPL